MNEKKWVLLTNDDGIEAPGFEHLVKAMNSAGIPLVAFAPSTNKSACSMQLNLGKPIDLHNRRELIEEWDLDDGWRAFVRTGWNSLRHDDCCIGWRSQTCFTRC